MRKRLEGNSGSKESADGRAALAVGTCVRTFSSANLRGAKAQSQIEQGVIVDDFGVAVAPHDRFGRDWALTKRWAKALDAGSLVFRDDDEIERET